MSEAQALVQLQEIDLCLMRHEAKLNDMPQVERMKTVLANKKKVSSELTKIKGLRKDLEMDIDELNSSRKSYEEQVENVKAKTLERDQNYRAINDLEAQLTSLVKRIEKVDFDLKDKLTRLETYKSQEAKGISIADKLDQEALMLKRSFDEETSSIRTQIDELKVEREDLVKDLSSSLLADYEKAKKRFQGLAVEILKGDTPSICRVQLQASSYFDLKAHSAISECPYCKRILIIEEGE